MGLTATVLVTCIFLNRPRPNSGWSVEYKPHINPVSNVQLLGVPCGVSRQRLNFFPFFWKKNVVHWDRGFIVPVLLDTFSYSQIHFNFHSFQPGNFLACRSIAVYIQLSYYFLVHHSIALGLQYTSWVPANRCYKCILVEI